MGGWYRPHGKIGFESQRRGGYVNSVHAMIRAGSAAGLAVLLAVFVQTSPAYAEDVGDCTLNLDWPHPSVHNPGRVTSNAVIKCRDKHAKLRVQTRIKWFPTPFGEHVRRTPWVEIEDARYASVAASFDNCVNGHVYMAEANFEIVDDDTVIRSHVTPIVAMERCP